MVPRREREEGRESIIIIITTQLYPITISKIYLECGILIKFAIKQIQVCVSVGDIQMCRIQIKSNTPLIVMNLAKFLIDPANDTINDKSTPSELEDKVLH